MKDYLLFRLYGPMVSWGDIAVGERRASFAHPTKSAIVGILAAALGLRREEESTHRALAEFYAFAVRVDTPGMLLRDYHTAQVPPSGLGRNRRKYFTRKSELDRARADLTTILSERDYRCDALFTVCVWTTSENAPFSLGQLAEALCRPAFTLYLGRKSCPPALPLRSQIVRASSLREAFAQSSFPDSSFLSGLRITEPIAVYWERDSDSGFELVHTIKRRDTPTSRRRWQFADREEFYGTFSPVSEE
jgi:CRISPR system Cascade subunit CasD